LKFSYKIFNILIFFIFQFYFFNFLNTKNRIPVSGNHRQCFSDLLHSSLDSSGSYREPNSSFHPLANQRQLTSSIGAGQLQFLGAPQRQNINNLMRLRLCPLGHSDPQIYTYTQTPFYVPISNTPTNAICTGRYSVASGGGHRSFLSASPQANKLQVRKNIQYKDNLCHSRKKRF
jgi:hypothetical protein